jgi:hypothetical protein
MNFLTADDAMLAQLQGIVQPVEIRDPSGKVLGHYTPLLSPEEAEAYEKAAAMFDWEEIERIAATEHGQGIPLAEFWRRLEAGEFPR